MPFFVSLVASSILGVLSGLGVGGGSLLIIWLTLVCRQDYLTSKYINLMFFIPPALIATSIHLIRREISFKQLFPAAVAGCIAAAGFTVLSGGWNTDTLRKLFGGLLLLTAVRELKYKKQQNNLQA